MARNRFLVGLIFLVFFVISLLTNILGPIVPDIISTFSVGLGAAGFLVFAFFIAYGVMSIPAGFLVERYSEAGHDLGVRRRCTRLHQLRTPSHIQGGIRLALRHRNRHGDAPGGHQSAAARLRWRGVLRAERDHRTTHLRIGILPQPLDLLLPRRQPSCRRSFWSRAAVEPDSQHSPARNAVATSMGLVVLDIRRRRSHDGRRSLAFALSRRSAHRGRAARHPRHVQEPHASPPGLALLPGDLRLCRLRAGNCQLDLAILKPLSRIRSAYDGRTRRLLVLGSHDGRLLRRSVSASHLR